MTNSDRLQEIRERAEEEQRAQRVLSADHAMAHHDRKYLLQLVTEQQREIEGLKGLVESYSEELDGIKAAYQI